jgi:hypothetical protein
VELQKVFMEEKVRTWVAELKCLEKVGKERPHEAFGLLVKAVSAKWRYLMAAVPKEVVTEVVGPLDTGMREVMEGIVGWEIEDEEWKRMLLAPKNGGLGVMDVKEVADTAYDRSRELFSELEGSLFRQKREPLPSPEKVRLKRAGLNGVRDMNEDLKVLEVMKGLEDRGGVGSNGRRGVGKKRGREGGGEEEQQGASSKDAGLGEVEAEVALAAMEDRVGHNYWWLLMPPVGWSGLCLDPWAFRVSVGARFGRLPRGLDRSACAYEGCEEGGSLGHRLMCKRPMVKRHNQVNDAWLKVLAHGVKGKVIWMPKMREVPKGMVFERKSVTTDEGAELDLAVRDFWGDGLWSFFDTRVFDPACHSYERMNGVKRYEKGEKEKRGKYEERVQRVEGGCFTPLVCSVFGGMGKDGLKVINRLVGMRMEGQGEMADADRSRVGREVMMEAVKVQMATLRAVAESVVGPPAGKAVIGKGWTGWGTGPGSGKEGGLDGDVIPSPETDVGWLGAMVELD